MENRFIFQAMTFNSHF